MNIIKLISFEGTVVFAENQEIGSIIYAYDGNDYILRYKNGKKIWIQYNENIEDDEDNIKFIDEDIKKNEEPYLSEYHLFIRKFLSTRLDIEWENRLIAANNEWVSS